MTAESFGTYTRDIIYYYYTIATPTVSRSLTIKNVLLAFDAEFPEIAKILKTPHTSP